MMWDNSALHMTVPFTPGTPSQQFNKVWNDRGEANDKGINTVFSLCCHFRKTTDFP